MLLSILSSNIGVDALRFRLQNGTYGNPLVEWRAARFWKHRLRLSVVHHDDRGNYRELSNGAAGAAFLVMMGVQPEVENTPTTPYEFVDFAAFRAAFESSVDIEEPVTAPGDILALQANLSAMYSGRSLLVSADLDDRSRLAPLTPSMGGPLEVSVDGGGFGPPWTVSPF